METFVELMHFEITSEFFLIAALLNDEAIIDLRLQFLENLFESTFLIILNY